MSISMALPVFFQWDSTSDENSLELVLVGFLAKIITATAE
jgi:hypothetical protein